MTPLEAIAAAPPGQGNLWPPTPAQRPTSWRIVSFAGSSPAIRDLAVAAARAGRLARVIGEAWLVGADATWCRVTYRGDVTPTTGWAAAAARIIERSTTA